MITARKATRRRWSAAVSAVVVAFGLAGAPAHAEPGHRSHHGWIDGAEFRVEVPRTWNGTLVLYSHGYLPVDVPGVALTNRPETEEWLLDHGYALAASDFQGVSGALYERGARDQVALLDWVDANVGTPRRVVALGSSSGGTMSVMLAERHPGRISGAASLCAPMDLVGTWNSFLDITFVTSALLAPDQGIESVRVTDPQRSAVLLQQAVDEASRTERGRARLALVAAVGNLRGWASAAGSAPEDPAGKLAAQVQWLRLVIGLFGPYARVDLEGRAGGNPSWNTGVDYGRQLARSAERELVAQAYRSAGADLAADLAVLAAAPRIGADPAAVDWLTRWGVPGGSAPSPVLTLHNVADVADPGHERWYADRVRRAGDNRMVRQLFTDRAGHCSFSAAEEVVALRTLFQRLDTGRWPSTAPDLLNTAARSFGPAFHTALDVTSFSDVDAPPAFTRFTPPAPMRPTE